MAPFGPDPEGQSQCTLGCRQGSEAVIDPRQSARKKQIRHNWNALPAVSIRLLSNSGRTEELVDSMKSTLLATVAVLLFASPLFAAETGKTVGQSPSSFFLAQDTATMKCQIVESQPAAGSSMKVVGAAHTTKASAEAALKADKTCAK